MNDEADCELTWDEWEALKSLRSSRSRPTSNRFVVDALIVLGLVELRDGSPVITRSGRCALVRGSSRLLLDLAA